MHRFVNAIRLLVATSWNVDRPLTGLWLLMLAALAVSVAGLVLDARLITGAPAWLKPVKFAMSIAIYSLTLVWAFSFLPSWKRTRRAVGWMTAFILVLEVVIIDLQAWRGTTSHFNVGTPIDAMLFSLMGLAIVVQTVGSIWVAVALWRQPFADLALGWALRLGLSITIVGAFTGGLMTRPTAEQLADARVTHQMPLAGAHTVGAPDGGPGLPGTGWSLEHGDVRVPHFLGLHAFQALPLLALAFRRRRLNESIRVRLVLVAGASYLSLFGIVLWQALRGQSLVNPDGGTIAVLAIWGILTAASAWVATAGGRPAGSRVWAY
jgi:hypothetical protein